MTRTSQDKVSPLDRRVGYVLKVLEHGQRMRMDRDLARIGITTPQFGVLAMLNQESGLSNAELSRRVFVTPQTMNAVLANLGRQGLVTRTRHPAHGRIIQYALTVAGIETHLRSFAVIDNLEREMFGDLSEKEIAQLRGLIERCIQTLDPEDDATALVHHHGANDEDHHDQRDNAKHHDDCEAGS